MRPPSAAVLVLLATLAACGGEHEPVPPPGGTDPILLVERHPGFGPPAEQWALPEFALLAGGTAVTRAPDQGIVLTGERRTLTAAQMTDLYRRAGDAGLFRSRTFDLEILDGSALVVGITSASGRYETTVVQPDPDNGGDRGRIARFATAAPQAGRPEGTYRPDRVAVVVVASSDDTTDVRPWPLDVPPTDLPGWPSRPCLVVTGATMASLLATVRTATPQTRWPAGDQAVALRVRPLLPYEKDCADARRG